MFTRRIRSAAVVAALSLAVPITLHAQQDQPVRYIQAERAGAVEGTSAAAIVGDVPLAHTGLILPIDPDGYRKGMLVGEGDAGRQFHRVVVNLRRALESVGSGLDRLVKVNVYATSRQALEAAKQRFAEAMPEGVKPAANFALTRLPTEGALVALDAVAVAPKNAERDNRNGARSSTGSDGNENRAAGDKVGGAKVSVMPPGGAAYYSGQVVWDDPGDSNRPDTTKETLEAFEKRLEYLNLDRSNVARVKVHVTDMKDADAVRRAVKSFFGPDAPPLVLIGWDHQLPVEIEMLAYAPPQSFQKQQQGPVQHINPPFLSASPAYSRIARVHGGKRIFISGLYARQPGNHEQQIRDIFRQLGRILEKTGSDFDHLVKAHYATIGREPWGPLHQVRTELYDPDRSPTSTLTPMEQLGMKDRTITIQMIAVTPE